ncbi:hypothetical protein V2J09_009057 [Rumex salicifolius]
MGIEKQLLRAGTGPKPVPGQNVTVHCTGFGKDGDLSQKFWSTKDPGSEPFSFQIGKGKVIKGTLLLMNYGHAMASSIFNFLRVQHIWCIDAKLYDVKENCDFTLTSIPVLGLQMKDSETDAFSCRRIGWDEGVLGMQVGEVARLTCSPDYAYGTSGFPAWGIKPNSVLVFEIEVLRAV